MLQLCSTMNFCKGMNMKKVVALVSLVMMSYSFPMENGRIATFIGSIGYGVKNMVLGTNCAMLVGVREKSQPTILAEDLEDSMTKREPRYSHQQQPDGSTLIVPVAAPVICLCSPENNGVFFETQEFGVKAGGKFLLTVDSERYQVDVTHNDVTVRVEDDTIANGRARYAQRDASKIIIGIESK